MSDLKGRILNVARELQLINFATVTTEGKPWVRYVVGMADDNLVFRFCTYIDSRKITHIKNNPEVHLSLGATTLEGTENWMQVAGRAEISTDKEERHSFWFDDLKNYFSGPDDPNYCVVIVRPSRIEFGTMGNMETEVWEE